MSCTKCKSKRTPVQTIVVNESVEIIPEPITLQSIVEEPKQLNFTRAELRRAIDFLEGRTSGHEEKAYLYEFHNKHHREQLKPSCAMCLPRIQTRLYEMKKILEEYVRHT
jgi:hypothetical protein